MLLEPSLPTDLGGQVTVATHSDGAAQFNSDGGHGFAATHRTCAIVGSLVMEVRRYTDLRRAHQRLLLQTKAMARYACDGDKAAGTKLYARIADEPTHPLSIWLIPYFEAMAPLEQAIAVQERTIAKLARQLPVWPWAATVNGLSDRFLGIIVGECNGLVGERRNPSCLWKRMGLAVINGGRQRYAAGDAANQHGFHGPRRELMWNVGESVIKQQVRSERDAEGNRVSGASRAIGPLGQVYLDRKAYELARGCTPFHAHNRAKRYMEKRLLRELWSAWRAAA